MSDQKKIARFLSQFWREDQMLTIRPRPEEFLQLGLIEPVAWSHSSQQYERVDHADNYRLTEKGKELWRQKPELPSPWELLREAASSRGLEVHIYAGHSWGSVMIVVEDPATGWAYEEAI